MFRTATVKIDEAMTESEVKAKPTSELIVSLAQIAIGPVAGEPSAVKATFDAITAEVDARIPKRA